MVEMKIRRIVVSHISFGDVRRLRPHAAEMAASAARAGPLQRRPAKAGYDLKSNPSGLRSHLWGPPEDGVKTFREPPRQFRC